MDLDGSGLAVLVGKAVEIRRKGAKAGADGLPSELLVFPFPTYENDHGTYVTDAASQKEIVGGFSDRGVKIPIDYEHQTHTGEIAPAAGFIGELVAGGTAGLIAKSIEWNDRAAEMVRSGEYRYHSPVYLYDPETMRIRALLSLALTNLPASHNQAELYEQIAAKAVARMKTIKAKGGNGMDEIIERLQYMLGLPVTTTLSELKAAVQRVIDALPDGDQMLFEVGAAKSDGSPATIAEVLMQTAKSEPDDAGAVELPVASAEVLELLEIEDDADLATVQAKLIELRSPAGVVTREEHDAVIAERDAAKAELAQLSAKSAEEQLDALIAANRPKVTPAKEPWVRQLAKKHGIEHAKEVISKMADELPRAQARGTDPAPEAPPVQAGQVGG
ncbi:MAG: phage protease, partial [Thermoanaerobaculia bacterium]